MTRTVSAVAVQKNLGQILDEAYSKGLSFIIEKARKPMAVVVPIDEYLVWEKRKAQLSKIIGVAAKRINLSEKDALSLVREARENTA